MRYGLFAVSICILFPSLRGYTQQQGDSLLTNATLSNVIAYALKQQPAVQQP